MKKNYLRLLLAKTSMFALLFSTQSHAQDTYTVESVSHQVYTSSMEVQYTVDDIYSEVIEIPFDFKFFGNIYNECIISTNGYINFNTELAGEPSLWQFNLPLPDPGFSKTNSILGCYHDLFAGLDEDDEATITWSVTGDAPYRQFVVMYNEQPNFSCEEVKSSFQIILYETFNYIDTQIIKRGVCDEWNNGNAVIGIVNATGEIGFTPPGRNTGNWAVTVPEGWRFRPETAYTYNYIKCDAGTDGLETFDFSVIQADLDPSAVFYMTAEDAELAVNPLAGTGYANTTPYAGTTIYAVFNGQVIPVLLSMVDCSLGFDDDTVASDMEDVNSDGNLANDDTDSDGLSDFIDNDDDGDQILTFEEYVFDILPGGMDPNPDAIDSDNDGIPNYLDNDDDDDGILTINEDYNQNGDPSDDDVNADGTPDYLEVAAAGITDFLQSNIILYPNPAIDVLNIQNSTSKEISDISIYAINGILVKQTSNAGTVNIADMQAGVYIVKVQVDNHVLNYRLIKK